jgi:hypothetical protein
VKRLSGRSDGAVVGQQAEHLEPVIDHASVLHDFVWFRALVMHSWQI